MSKIPFNIAKLSEEKKIEVKPKMSKQKIPILVQENQEETKQDSKLKYLITLFIIQ